MQIPKYNFGFFKGEYNIRSMGVLRDKYALHYPGTSVLNNRGLYSHRGKVLYLPKSSFLDAHMQIPRYKYINQAHICKYLDTNKLTRPIYVNTWIQIH